MKSTFVLLHCYGLWIPKLNVTPPPFHSPTSPPQKINHIIKNTLQNIVLTTTFTKETLSIANTLNTYWFNLKLNKTDSETDLCFHWKVYSLMQHLAVGVSIGTENSNMIKLGESHAALCLETHRVSPDMWNERIMKILIFQKKNIKSTFNFSVHVGCQILSTYVFLAQIKKSNKTYSIYIKVCRSGRN